MNRTFDSAVKNNLRSFDSKLFDEYVRKRPGSKEFLGFFVWIRSVLVPLQRKGIHFQDSLSMVQINGCEFSQGKAIPLNGIEFDGKDAKEVGMKSIYMVIKKEHEAVEEIINLLKERLKAIPIHSEAISQEEVEELRFLFSYFLKRIQFHFDVEETLGFIEDLRNRHPDASRTVHHILDGHREIRKKMDHVIQQISVLDYLRTEPATSLIDLFKDITEEIQKHEEEENSAALMAVNQDTGNKD